MSKLLGMMQKNVDAMRRIAAVIGMPSTDAGAVADRVLAERDAAISVEAVTRRLFAEYVCNRNAVQWINVIREELKLPELSRDDFKAERRAMGEWVDDTEVCAIAEMAATTGEEAQP